jgi:hypothetical protein
MAAEPRHREVPILVVEGNQRLVAKIVRDGDREVTHYFVEEPNAPVVAEEIMQAALDAIGSWSDLDWDETAAELDRIRHQSIPTPPIEL